MELNAEQVVIADKLVAYFEITRKGNKKLGNIYSWSIPAVTTCPGRTQLCESVCYAKKMQTRWTSVRNAWQRNFELSKREDFPFILDNALARLSPNMIRIHVSGDFYSVDYLNAWLYALKRNAHILPFAFTRSWRVKAIAKRIKLTRPGWLYASIDSEDSNAPSFMKTAKMDMDTAAKIKGSVNPGLRAVKDICTEQIAPDKVNCKSCGRCPGFRQASNGLVNIVTRRNVVFAGH